MSTQEVEFVDMRLPHYANAVKALKNRGFSSTRSTKGTKQTILLNYYKFLVHARTMELGRQLTPKELEEIHNYAKDNVDYYEMYTKTTKQSRRAMRENNNNGAGASAAAAPEMFATNEEVERMQPNYQLFENISRRFSNSLRMPRTNMPARGYAASLKLDPQYNIRNLYNYRRTQGYRNNNRNNRNNNSVDGGARRRRTRRNKTHRKRRA